MMIQLKHLFPALLLLAAISAHSAGSPGDPQEVVKETADKVFQQVAERKAELEADPKKIYPLVQTYILPHFDFDYMTRLAMGRFWRDASEAQRQSVVTEFRQLLVRTYASALLSYTGQPIDYLPVNAPDDSGRVMVPTKVYAGGGPPVPVNYRLHQVDGAWQVYDVLVDGISLVSNYRGTFAREIQRGAAGGGTQEERMSRGIDALVEALAGKNTSGGQ